ncbi:hypothetical protein GCM10027176_38340 [Actinoallomurus bryophytorum]
MVQARLVKEAAEGQVRLALELRAGAQAPCQLVDPRVRLSVEPVPHARVDPLSPHAEPVRDPAYVRLDLGEEAGSRPRLGGRSEALAEVARVERGLGARPCQADRGLQLQLVGQPVGQVLEAALELLPGERAVQVLLVQRPPAGVESLPHVVGPWPRPVGVDPGLLSYHPVGHYGDVQVVVELRQPGLQCPGQSRGDGRVVRLLDLGVDRTVAVGDRADEMVRDAGPAGQRLRLEARVRP